MVQLSQAYLHPATQDPSAFPDFVAKLTFKTPPSASNISIQFNLLSEKSWTQLVFDPRGMAPASNNIGMNIGATSASINVDYPNQPTLYVVQPNQAPWVSDVDTGVDNGVVESGSASIIVELKGLDLTGSIVEQTGKVLYTQTWPMPYAPCVFCCEAVGADSGISVSFTAFDATLGFSSSIPIAGAMGPISISGLSLEQFGPWGTYADPNFFNGNSFPLYWQDETGESSNLWTSVASQAPTSVELEYSLVEGNQAFSNPSPSTPAPTNLFNSGPPTTGQLGSFPALVTSWTNPTSTDLAGIVFVVLKNRLNQTVAVTTGSGIFPANSATDIFNPMIQTPPTGVYSATAFVITFDGRPLTSSTSSTVVF